MKHIIGGMGVLLAGAVGFGAPVVAQTLLPSMAVQAPGPMTALPTQITVTGKRTKPCEEKDKSCILAIAQEVWTHYPSQIQYYCESARTHKAMERMLVDQLGLSSAYDSESTTRAYDTLPPALAAVCGYKTDHVHQIASNWAPWTRVPSDADLTAAFPRSAKGGAGDARINCKVEDNGNLEDCHLSDEEPADQGFGKAALHLSGKFHVNRVVAREKRPEALWVDVAIHFSRSDEGSRQIASPDWTLLPDPALSATLYPAEAAKAGVASGVGKVDCRVTEDGRLSDCALVGEEPASLGFGAAALSAVSQLRANLWTPRWTKDGGRPRHCAPAFRRSGERSAARVRRRLTVNPASGAADPLSPPRPRRPGSPAPHPRVGLPPESPSSWIRG